MRPFRPWAVVIAVVLGTGIGTLAAYAYRQAVPYADNLSVAAVSFVVAFLVAAMAWLILTEEN